MKTRLIAFSVAALILLAIPVGQILRYETVIHRGKTFIFKCEPYDPYDPFRGRYVRIRVGNEVKLSKKLKTAKQNSWRSIIGWTVVEIGQDGLAHCVGFTLNKPDNGDYIKCHGKKKYSNKKQNSWRVDLEVDRIFMNEKLAPRAEQAQRNSKNNFTVELKLYKGKVVPVKLYMNGKPVVEQLKNGVKP